MTIGNFDGVHLGHQTVLRRLQQKAEQLGLPAVVMTFEPQPLELFMQQKAPARLTRLRDKFVQLSKLELERLLCINFNQQFADMPPEQFIEQLLVDKLGVRYLVIGDDFRFGRQRKGDFRLLQQAGREFGFEVVSTDSFCLAEERVSSTAIRQALAHNDLELAQHMLGRPYSVSGRVSHGQKLGRTIGFPTANIPLQRCVSPVSGVYVVTTEVNGRTYGGVANVGKRPTVEGVHQLLEVHLFDFSDDLYGKQLEVCLLHKLREEAKFASFDALKNQIQLDAEAARVWLLQSER